MKNLGLVYQATEEWEQAIDCFQKSIKYKNIVGDLNGVEQVYGNLGITWQSLKKYDEAVKTYQLALDRMDRNGDLAGMAQTYSNLGVIYFDLKNYKEALKLLNQTLFFFMKQESTEDIKNVSNILSNIQNEMDKKKFSDIADAALNSVAKNGNRWRTQTALSADDAQEILKRLQKRKKKRMAQEDRLPEVKKIELENSLRGDAQGHSK